MKIGMIGLGKMGGNMRGRLRAAGHEVVGYDLAPDVRDVDSLVELAAALHDDAHPRVVWVMVPHGKPTSDTVHALADVLTEGDLVIEGGNSKFTDDAAHDAYLAERGIGYLDCGVSGGVWGLDNGYGLMAGGRPEHVELAMPVFDALRPEGPREEGFVHAGDVGAGHYAKMVHNGIEYGLMAAYAEGYELLTAKEIVHDVPGCFQAWSRGTVVRSWLLDLAVKALHETPDLKDVSGYSTDSGEGRWTVEQGLENAVPTPVIASALFSRFTSRQENSPAMQLIAALRGQFGGHQVMTLEEGREARAGAHEVPRQVHPGAERKHTEGEATPGADDEGEEVSESGAEQAGPSSGSGETGTSDADEAGPTSGSGDTHIRGAAPPGSPPTHTRS